MCAPAVTPPPATASVVPVPNRAPTSAFPATWSVTAPPTTPVNDAPPVTDSVAGVAAEFVIVPDPASDATASGQPFRSSVAPASTRSAVPAGRCPARSMSAWSVLPSHFSASAFSTRRVSASSRIRSKQRISQ